jgi:CRISPR-associated protein Cst1
MTDERPILRWTGHPLVDAGVAALTAFAGKRDPAEVTGEDLAAYAEFAEQHYLGGDLSKTVGILFTMNSFLNPNPKLKPDQKRERIRDAVTAFEKNPDDATLPRCVFCDRPSRRVLHRDDIPMILGRTIVNFYPGGTPGLAVCGACQVALHGLTVGAPRISGKALVVSADDPSFLTEIVSEWVQQARRYASVEQASGASLTLKNPRTRMVEALLRVQRQAARADQPVGLVGYHISNSGQGPGIDVYALPSTVVRFVQRAGAARYRQAWEAIQRRAWQRKRIERKWESAADQDTIETDERGQSVRRKRIGRKWESAADLDEEQRAECRNFLYEDLFRLPDEAGRFIRLYFLRNPAGLVRQRDEDPRAEYRTATELDVVSWELAELFLKEVVGMEQTRIDAIRTLGDRLAEEIDENNDRQLLGRAYRARDYGTIRRLLLRADLARLNRRQAPVVGFDEFLVVFEEGEELARVDWRLAWDLVLIRVIEQLYQRGKTELVQEAVSTGELEDEAREPEAAAV